MPLKRWIRAALGAACLALPCGVHAAGLFLPIAPAGVAGEPRGASPAMAGQEQRVRIARHELSAVRHDVENAGAGRLVLNVADGAHFDVAVERTAPTKWGYSLSGRVAGGGAGFVTLVVHENVVAGSIWTPNTSYELLPLGSGIHALRDITNQPAFKCGSKLEQELGTIDVPPSTDDGSVVDILVVYTSAAEERFLRVRERASAADARSQMEAFAHLGIAVTNDAFERSGAFVSLNLVGVEKVDYQAATPREDFFVLRSEGVQALRDRLGADLVHAIVGCCNGAAIEDGLSYLTYGSDVIYVAHEIGHNFGIAHERNQFGRGPLDYRHGFTTAGCDKTIMSYGTECRDRGRPFVRPPFFASPWRYSPGDGRALGVTKFWADRGANGPANAVLALNRNRHRVANYRPSRRGE